MGHIFRNRGNSASKKRALNNSCTFHDLRAASDAPSKKPEVKARACAGASRSASSFTFWHVGLEDSCINSIKV